MPDSAAEKLNACIKEMGMIYRADPVKAVRSQSFIKLLHAYLIDDLTGRLTPQAKKRGIAVRDEVTVLGSHKPKDVDVAVVDPDNGPLLMVGVRSQMSSIGNNVLNYYEGIVGECISLQDRFPMCTIGYVYVMPQRPIKEGKEGESIDHQRFARMYAAITGRGGVDYKNVRGVYDEFAYMVVDFDGDPPSLVDDAYTVADGVDLAIGTFVDRIVAKFNDRMLFWEVFQGRDEEGPLKQ